MQRVGSGLVLLQVVDGLGLVQKTQTTVVAAFNLTAPSNIAVNRDGDLYKRAGQMRAFCPFASLPIA
ncbi:hypothetical protein CKO23_21790 [Thiocystis violacea]|nr:hypothetical protein [Thiocystis violacea]